MSGTTRPAEPNANKKKGKRFLNQTDTLKLAAVIADSKEKVVNNLLQKHSSQTRAESQRSQKTRKSRIAGIKEQLIAERARLKKAKAQTRKQSLRAPVPCLDDLPSRKRVCFAE
ncbi:hypothetical protein C8R42DRAFT_685617 [Lentinula raphanica]|nr:hypothetical protein C8R42DRAFT_685617 [Lentinula raphanica]